jgi:nicotinate-nucleotide pyrophosphorylase (carboxylating)
MDNLFIDKIIKKALQEDIAAGDITTNAVIGENEVSSAYIIAKECGIICGQTVAQRVFKLLDSTCEYKILKRDGEKVEKGEILAQISGKTRALLTGERTALNFLQRMSGIATMTAKTAEKIKGTSAKICDTRKTAPNLRIFDKYAVKAGGGFNHRFGLYDGAMIKDNHIKAAGGIKEAVEKVRAVVPHTVKIEVETETIEQVKEALACGADIIMLDNMDFEQMREAVKLIGGRAEIEVSGNMDGKDITKIARLGVDFISMGALTHSVKALDISMKFN